MDDLYARLHARWRQQGLVAGAGVSPTALAAAEQRLGVALPIEMRAYFAAANGVVGGRDGAWDHDLVAFWPLEEVAALATLSPDSPVADPARYVVFADWSIDAWFYAVRVPEPGNALAPVSIVADSRLISVAPSLAAFFAGYVAGDPAVLYGPAAPLS